MGLKWPCGQSYIPFCIIPLNLGHIMYISYQIFLTVAQSQCWEWLCQSMIATWLCKRSDNPYLDVHGYPIPLTIFSCILCVRKILTSPHALNNTNNRHQQCQHLPKPISFSVAHLAFIHIDYKENYRRVELYNLTRVMNNIHDTLCKSLVRSFYFTNY